MSLPIDKKFLHPHRKKALSSPGLGIVTSVILASAALTVGLSRQRQQPSGAARLRFGVPVRRTIKRGQTDWYQVEFRAKTFFRIELNQHEIDVSLLAANGDGDTLAKTDFGRFGAEEISIITGRAGIYWVRVRAAQDSTARGSYEIRLSEERLARRDDLKLLTAQRAFAQAQQAPPNKAISLYQSAARLWAEVGDLRGEEAATDRLGVAYSRSGRWQDAYQCYQRALALAEDRKDEYARLEALEQIGRLKVTLGEQFGFVPSDFEFLRLWERLGDRRGIARSLAALSDHYRVDEHDHRKALEFANRAVAMNRALGDERSERRSLESVASAELALGENQAALQVSLRILRLNRDAGDRYGEAAALGRVASVLDRLGRYQESKSYYEQELKLREAQGDQTAQDFLNDYIATIDMLLNQPFDALAHVKSALTIEKSIRSDTPSPKWRAAFSGDRNITPLYAWTLLSLDAKRPNAGYKDEAFLAVDRAHGRVLFDDPTVLTHIKIADIQRRLLDENTVLLEYSLGRDVAFKHDRVLWVVTPTRVSAYELPVRSEIERFVDEAYGALSAPGRSDEALKHLSQSLLGPAVGQLGARRILIVPDGVLEYLPFSALSDPARPDGGPLALDHEIEYLPSATAALALRSKRAALPLPQHSMAVIADPVFNRDDPRLAPGRQASVNSASQNGSNLSKALRSLGFRQSHIPRLPYSRLEAQWALKWLPAGEKSAFLDFSANRDLVLSGRLSDYRIVHFATHGLVNDEDPELSGLVLSRVARNGRPIEGFLSLRDLYALKLPADLVILSACDTALARIYHGEGMLSLTTGFLYAGAGSVLSTIWKVNDEATAEFMKAFYAELLGPHHRSPAGALKAAQESFYGSPRWHSPYYWAGFVLNGVDL